MLTNMKKTSFQQELRSMSLCDLQIAKEETFYFDCKTDQEKERLGKFRDAIREEIKYRVDLLMKKLI